MVQRGEPTHGDPGEAPSMEHPEGKERPGKATPNGGEVVIPRDSRVISFHGLQYHFASPLPCLFRRQDIAILYDPCDISVIYLRLAPGLVVEARCSNTPDRALSPWNWALAQQAQVRYLVVGQATKADAPLTPSSKGLVERPFNKLSVAPGPCATKAAWCWATPDHPGGRNRKDPTMTTQNDPRHVAPIDPAASDQRQDLPGDPTPPRGAQVDAQPIDCVIIAHDGTAITRRLAIYCAVDAATRYVIGTIVTPEPLTEEAIDAWLDGLTPHPDAPESLTTA